GDATSSHPIASRAQPSWLQAIVVAGRGVPPALLAFGAAVLLVELAAVAPLELLLADAGALVRDAAARTAATARSGAAAARGAAASAALRAADARDLADALRVPLRITAIRIGAADRSDARIARRIERHAGAAERVRARLPAAGR